MKTYWDTSAAINAAVSEAVAKRLESGQHCARLHLFSEFFSTMTGRGVSSVDAEGKPVKVLFDPDDCATWLRDFRSKVTLMELDASEVLDAIDRAQSRSVQGARIYDYLHARAASKANADELLTRNPDHFTGLSDKVKVVWP